MNTRNVRRWTRRWGIFGLAVGMALGSASLLSGAEREPRASNRTMMRAKLAWSSGILEGLTLEKYDLVSRNALRLRDLTQSNLWYTTRQPEYMSLTTNFQASAQAVYLAAADKNLNSATEAYARMNRACVECHRLVRVEQRATKTAPRP